MTTKPTRLIRLPEVLSRTAMSKSRFYQATNPKHPKYDERAPRPVRMGSTVAFVEAEVEEWLQVLVQRGRDQNDRKAEAA